jgi:diguanylate cyclase (GGDEF)-like protein
MRFGIFLSGAVLACSLKVSLPGIAGARSVNYLFILIGVIMLDLPQTLLVGVACTLMQCLWKPKQRPTPIHLLRARILAADCLDALSSPRLYRRALPLDEAIGFIVAQSGISFDPRVVDILRRRYLEWWDLAGAAAEDVSLSSNARASLRTPADGRADMRSRYPSPDRSVDRSPDRSGAPPNFTVAIAAARQEFQSLHEVTSELGNSLSMEETMSLLGTRLKGIVPHDAIAIYVCQGDRLVPQYVDGRDFQLFSSLKIPIGQGLSGWVAENRKAIVNGNPSVEPGYLNDPAILSNLNSAISVPLLGVSGVLGVLTLYHEQRDAFTRDHLRLLLAISSKAALTIENALKYSEVQKSAVTDDLTGLPSTRSLFLHLDSEVARCKRTNTPLAVLVADLDGFKLVNDRFGHLAGNKVLKRVAHGLTSACREYDYVARMGGDEFVLILPGMQAGALTNKCRELCSTVIEAGRESTGEELLSLSVGEAFFPEDGVDAEELLAAADRRMYRVKRSHRAARIRDVRLINPVQTPPQTTSVQ